MNTHLIDASLLGAIQGLGEFLPISSSGHLLLAHYFLQYNADNSLTFDVALHIGTLLALIVYFWRDIIALLTNFIRSWRQRPWTPELRLPWLIILAAIPAAIIGGLFDSFFETIRNPWVVIVTFLLFGGLFIWTERRRGQNVALVSDINWKTALAIGLAQVLALVPGVSRSGITIITGMWAGLRRDQAARFTFLLSIPVVAGAAAKKFLDLRQTGIPDDERIPMLVGIAVAAIVGYAVIRFLLRFLGHHKLNVFAYYRFIVAAIAAIAIWLR